MLTEKEIKIKRKNIINRIFEGNLYRFLRRHRKQSNFQTVYLDYLRKWEKEPIKRDIVKQMKSKLIWPENIVNIVNLMCTLKRHYEFEFDEECARVAWEIQTYFEDDIRKYREAKNLILYQKIGHQQTLTPEKALKEQKARGFIKADKFDDFDRKACHVQSTVDLDYIYPMNFYLNTYPKDLDRKRGPYLIYIGQHLAGVRGYTRCRIPKHYTHGKI